MPTPAAQSFDFLTGAGADYVQPIMADLADTSWQSCCSRRSTLPAA
jgi:hypothetical protein